MNPRAFFLSMTFWNWLSLALVVPAILGGLNAALSLKSRYLDWRGTKNKTKFDKRLDQLKSELVRLENYKRDLYAFFLQVLDDAVGPLMLCFAALVFFIGAFAIYGLPLTGFGVFELLYLCIALLLMLNAFVLLVKLSRFIRHVNRPEMFAIEVIDFVKNASDKGLNSAEADQLIILIHKSDMFTESEQKKVSNYIAARLPNKLVDIFHSYKKPKENLLPPT